MARPTPETIESFAARVRTKDPETYKNVDDNTLVYQVLDEHPQYQYRFEESVRRGNAFVELFKQGLLGFSETFGKTYEQSARTFADLIAKETISEEEYNALPERTDRGRRIVRAPYEDYVKRNEEKRKVQEKALLHAQDMGKFFDETLPEKLDVDPNFGTSGLGLIASQVARGLGQFAGYGTAGFTVGGATTLATGNPALGGAAGTGAVYYTAFMNRADEFVADAERTMEKSLVDMNQEERDMVTTGSMIHGGIAGLLDATVFKYVAGAPSIINKTLNTLAKGGKVSEKAAKTAFSVAARNALGRGGLEGTQESIGDGMVLDLIAKNLYDSDREFITGEALGRRVMEFTVGGLTGAIGSVAGDTTRTALGQDITMTDEEKAFLRKEGKDVQIAIDSSTPNTDIDQSITDFDNKQEEETIDIEVFDRDGNATVVQMTGYTVDPDGRKTITYKDPSSADPEQSYTLDGLGAFYSRNPKAKDFKLSTIDKTIGELTDSEVTDNIKSLQTEIEKGSDNQATIDRANLDLQALLVEQYRRTRKEEQKQDKRTPIKGDTNAKPRYTFKYFSKQTGEQVYGVVEANSREEAEVEFKKAYKNLFSSDAGYTLVSDTETKVDTDTCLLYTSPSPRDISGARMPSSA